MHVSKDSMWREILKNFPKFWELNGCKIFLAPRPAVKCSWRQWRIQAPALLVSLNSSLNYCSIKHKSSLNLHYQSTCPLLSPLLDVILDPPLVISIATTEGSVSSSRAFLRSCWELKSPIQFLFSSWDAASGAGKKAGMTVADPVVTCIADLAF